MKPVELILAFSSKQPPLSALALAKYAGLALKATPGEVSEAVLKLETGDTISGSLNIARYISRLGSGQLLGTGAYQQTQIDWWLDFVFTNIVTGSSFQTAACSINDHLALNSFMVGYDVSAADVALWGQLAGTPMWPRLKKTGAAPHLTRWFDYVSQLPLITATQASFAPASGAAKGGAAKAASGKGGGKGSSVETATGVRGVVKEQGSFDVNLKNVEMGKVVTRFPPEPSGYLHIGHAKAALLNQYFAEKYKGTLIVRFDDTNPSKEKDEYVENILADIKLLGLKHDKLTHTSDYFPQLIQMAELLIKAGHMYGDDTPQEKMREERMDGIESACRNKTVEENLADWKEMQEATEKGLSLCMRIKLDMSHPNKALRDPVAYRCNLNPHWRTGTKYKVYPTYDAACPFVDSYEGVTHVLRTSEYKDREAQFYWILKIMREVWPEPLPECHIWDYSRLSFVNTVLSKRKLAWFVDTGRVLGWNDPRFPTVQGILRRGMTIQALREFILAQGASRNVTVQEWDKIWTINKKHIDPVCPRHSSVLVSSYDPKPDVPVGATTPVVLTISGIDKEQLVTVPRHKKHPPAGTKVVVRSPKVYLDQVDAAAISDGEEVTLMDWGNVIINKVEKNKDGIAVSAQGTLHLEGSVKSTKLKLTWVPVVDDLVPLRLVNFDYLINKKKIEEDDDFESVVNQETWFEQAALGDPSMRMLKTGDICQLERRAFYRVDQHYVKEDTPMLLFQIPTGKPGK